MCEHCHVLLNALYTQDMVLANKEASAIAGYEVMDFDNPKPKEQVRVGNYQTLATVNVFVYT